MRSSGLMHMIFLAAAVSSALLFSACSSQSPEPKPALQAPQLSDEEMLAEDMVSSMLTAIRKNDRDQFVRYMVDEMKTSITDEAFKAMVTEFNKKKGPYISRKYLGSLEQPFFRVYLWKAKFAPSKEMVEAFRKKGKSESDIPVTDTLIRLELGNVDKSIKVFGIYFQ